MLRKFFEMGICKLTNFYLLEAIFSATINGEYKGLAYLASTGALGESTDLL